MPGDSASLTEDFLGHARTLGFHRVGLCPIEPTRSWEAYDAWVRAGHAGAMEYMTDPELVLARKTPASVLPAGRTLVVVALSYGAPEPAPGGTDVAVGRIARYARGEDYHGVLKAKLRDLATWLEARSGRTVLHRPCVDTAPLLERHWAEAAGLGFVAKNTMLIAPGLGSYVVLGELLVDVELAAPARPPTAAKGCGRCRACLDACPTAAFVDAFVLDARRCISYLTIELQGAIPRDLRAAVGDHLFGCDICQDVCPFNTRTEIGKAAPAAPALLGPSRITVESWLRMTATDYRRLVRNRALGRATRQQLLRNACVVAGNSGDQTLLPALRSLLDAPWAVVRLHAVWALGRLGAIETLRMHGAWEDDRTVRDELMHWVAPRDLS